jgi:hypothetical protein
MGVMRIAIMVTETDEIVLLTVNHTVNVKAAKYITHEKQFPTPTYR